MGKSGNGVGRRARLYGRRGPRSLRATMIVAVLGLSVWGCSAARQPEPVPYDIEPWRFGRTEGQKIITPHYEVHTTLTDRVLLETFPELIERAYARYRELVPPAHEPEERMRVYLFATRPQWVAFTQRFTGPRAGTFLKVRGGGYSEDGVSVIQYVAHQVTFPLLAHEGFHQYLHHCVNGAVPAWVNEGLAVASEGQRWTGSGLQAFDPWYNPVRRNQLAEALLRDRLFPLPELLGTHAGNVVQETSVRVATYYAQVWGLVLFLEEGANGKYADGFRRLLQSLSAPDLEQRLLAESVFSEQRTELSRGEALFRSFISDDLEAVEREYVVFLRQRILNER